MSRFLLNFFNLNRNKNRKFEGSRSNFQGTTSRQISKQAKIEIIRKVSFILFSSVSLYIVCFSIIESITHYISSSSKSRSSSGKSPASTFEGRTKPPYLSGHSKYFLPPTLPLFLPWGSSY